MWRLRSVGSGDVQGWDFNIDQENKFKENSKKNKEETDLHERFALMVSHTYHVVGSKFGKTLIMLKTSKQQP